MHFRYYHMLFLSIFVTSLSFAQTFTIRARITDPQIKEITISEAFRSDAPAEGSPSLYVPKRMYHLKKRTPTSQTFAQKNNVIHIDFKTPKIGFKSSQGFLLIDQSQQFGTVLRVKNEQVRKGLGEIDLKEISLERLQVVSGTIQMPKGFIYSDLSPPFIQTAYDLGPKKYPLGLSSLHIDPETGNFSTLLPPGDYIFYIDVKSLSLNYFQNTQKITVKDEPIDMGNIDMNVKISSLVGKLNLKDILQHLSFDEGYESLLDTSDFFADRRVVGLNFYAPYCSYCYRDYRHITKKDKKLGIITHDRVFKEARKHPDKVMWLSIESDYTAYSEYPQSQEEYHRFRTEKKMVPRKGVFRKKRDQWKRWKLVKSWHEKYNTEDNLFSIWQAPNFAKKVMLDTLNIESYPLVLIFTYDEDSGEKLLSHWSLGAHAKLYKTFADDL